MADLLSSSRARCPSLRPAAGRGDKFFMCQRRHCAHRAVGASHHVGEVTLTVVPWLWIDGGGVTVYAARMGQNRIDLLPSGDALGAACGRTPCVTGLAERAGDNHPCTECTRKRGD